MKCCGHLSCLKHFSIQAFATWGGGACSEEEELGSFGCCEQREAKLGMANQLFIAATREETTVVMVREVAFKGIVNESYLCVQLPGHYYHTLAFLSGRKTQGNFPRHQNRWELDGSPRLLCLNLIGLEQDGLMCLHHRQKKVAPLREEHPASWQLLRMSLLIVIVIFNDHPCPVSGSHSASMFCTEAFLCPEMISWTKRGGLLVDWLPALCPLWGTER